MEQYGDQKIYQFNQLESGSSGNYDIENEKKAWAAGYQNKDNQLKAINQSEICRLFLSSFVLTAPSSKYTITFPSDPDFLGF